MVSHFLGVQSDISKGRNFRTIEEISEVQIRGVNPVPHRRVKQFNSKGSIVSDIIYNSAGGTSRETNWEYIDGVNLRRKHHRFFANIIGWQEEEVVIDWDSTTNLPQHIKVTKNGRVWQTAIIQPDTLGRIESARVLNANGGHVFTERFMYLESSNMIRITVFRPNGVFQSTWSYPIDRSKPFSFESVKRQYYPNGDVMVETLTNAVKGDQAYFYEYEYDGQGNWIERNNYQVELGRNDRIRRKKLEHKITRTITYQ